MTYGWTRSRVTLPTIGFDQQHEPMKGVSFARVWGGRKQQKIGCGIGESLVKLETGHLVGAAPESVRFINYDKVPAGGDQVLEKTRSRLYSPTCSVLHPRRLSRGLTEIHRDDDLRKQLPSVGGQNILERDYSSRQFPGRVGGTIRFSVLMSSESTSCKFAPKGLVSQWVSEMRFHFGENLQLVLPEDIKTLKRIVPPTSQGTDEKSNHAPDVLPANTWQLFSQVVVPMDSVKPLDKRRGWTTEQVGEYNRERFEDLISAGWDLVIVDEAHRLGGSTDQVARFKLGQGLADAAPYFLLLSATPHQGKTDAFHRLVSLIEAEEFPDVGSVTRERVQPYVIRTEKRGAIDSDGKPLFKPRRTQLAPVSWGDRHRNQRLLYDAVTEYVREGYNQAVREKRSYIGFLMILMQRLVVSSTSAIRTTLERRIEALAAPPEQLTLFPLASEDEWADLDGQEQIEVLLGTRLKALKNERAEVKLLLDAAAHCEQIGPDAKAEALLDWLYRLQSEESDPDLKVLVFTEFVPTQEMLRQFLAERGFSIVCLNGSMDTEERERVQETFAKDARILISTDAGGEGLNLQFCHVVINYDIPWNPMRLEQRIGRVDRIGQAHAVRAVNFVFEGSVEHRVREVLERKLAIIFEEFGIDKTGDVLDTAQAGRMFDDMYVEAILNPDRVETPLKV